MRAALLRPRRLDRATSPSAWSTSARRASAARDLDIRDADGVEAHLRRATPPTSSWSSTPPPSPRTTGPRASPQTDFSRQRHRHAEPARGHAPPRARGAVHLLLDQQGLRRPAQPAAAARAADSGSSCPTTTATSRGIDTTMSIDRSTHSLFGVSKAAADLLVQEYGRYFDMPTVCFRGGCLTGPGHAGAELHGFLAYLMKCTVTGDPYTVFGYDGQAGARQHPLRRPGARVRRLPPRPARRGGLQHRRRRATATARCSRRSPPASRSPGASSTGRSRDQHRIGDHRWWISDLSELPAPTTRIGSSATGSRTILREIHDANVERSGWRRAHEALGRDPRPQRGGLDRGRRCTASRTCSSARSIDYEVLVVDDASSDGTGADRARRSAQPARALRALAQPARASGSRCAPASTPTTATRSRS